MSSATVGLVRPPMQGGAGMPAIGVAEPPVVMATGESIRKKRKKKMPMQVDVGKKPMGKMESPRKMGRPNMKPDPMKEMMGAPSSSVPMPAPAKKGMK